MPLLFALLLFLAPPTTGDEWFQAASAHLQKNETAAAIEAYEKAWALGASNRFVAAYNLACLQARAGRLDEAFAWLDRIKGMGLQAEQAAADPDLAPLLKDARWPALVAAIDAAAHPCRAPRHHELDFWVGEWTVRNSAGTEVGASRIESILDGCVVLENWTGRMGGSGKSFNTYDAAHDRWQQTWVSDRGVLNEYHGRLEGGAMRYASESPVSRLTFTPLPDGRVRQLSEVRNPGGTWSVGYDFYYTRR